MSDLLMLKFYPSFFVFIRTENIKENCEKRVELCNKRWVEV